MSKRSTKKGSSVAEKVTRDVNARYNRGQQLATEEDYAPPVENVEMNDDNIGSAGRGLQSSSSSMGAGLRRRAALDGSFSSGKYEAKPLSVADAESRMDSIFGLLDGGEDDVGDGDDDDDAMLTGDDFDDGVALPTPTGSKRKQGEKSSSATAAQGKKRRRPETEEDFERALEKRFEALQKTSSEVRKAKVKSGDQHTKSAAALGGESTAGATTQDADVMRQLAELRKRQSESVNLVAKDDAELSSSSLLGDKADGQATTVGDLVRQWSNIANQVLGVRVRMQNCVADVVRFPQPDTFPEYASLVEGNSSSSSSSKATGESPTFATAANQTKRLLTDMFGLARNVSNNTKCGSGASPNWSTEQFIAAVSKYDEDIMKTVDGVVEHWGARSTPGGAIAGKLKAINQPLLEQIRAINTGKARLLNKVQRNRSHLPIFGKRTDDGNRTQRAAEIASGDFDTEIFDDADFVRELVHRSGNAHLKVAETQVEDSASRVANAIGEAPKNNSKRNRVHYEVHPKLVGFMAPVAFQKSYKHEALLKSLFQ